MSTCGHHWEPVLGWNGRYRCRWCGALAYRQLINGGIRGVPHHIVVYVCRRAGCKEPAVVGPRKGQRCRDHAKPEDLSDSQPSNVNA